MKNVLLCGFVRSGWSTIYDAEGNLITRYEGALPLNDFTNGNTASGSNPALIFGTGTRAPAAADRALASKWTGNISRVAVVNGEIQYDAATHTAPGRSRPRCRTPASTP